MLSKLTIKAKLFFLVVIIALAFIFVGISTSNQFSTLSNGYDKTSQINKKVNHLKSILIGGLLVNSASNVFILDNTNKKPLKTIKSGIKKVKTYLNEYQKLDDKNIQKVTDATNKFIQEAQKLSLYANTNGTLSLQQTKALLKVWRPLKSVLQKEAVRLKKVSDLTGKEYNDTISSSTRYILLFIGVIVIFGVIVALLISRNISNSIESLHKGVQAIKTNTGGISKVTIVSKDEIGEIAHDFNEYLEQIESIQKQDMELIKEAQRVIERVKHGWYSEYIEKSTSNTTLETFKNDVNAMIKATQEHFINVNLILEEYASLDYRKPLKLDGIESGGVFEVLVNDINKLRETIVGILTTNMHNGLDLQKNADTLVKNVETLNTSSNESAAALEETAAALEEVTSTISSTTDTIINMSNLASDVTNSAQSGQSLANETTKAMDEINTKVSAINDAITVIDQIAFQTNILSLNAAVEAATAGEAGKGFAVVAGEVRNLASRSSDAANEIKALVESATQKANNGKSIADEMIEGYNGLNKNIETTIELISNVESSSKEQLAGLQQINDAINALDTKTQQNANVATETNGIAQQTDSLAKEILSDVDEKNFDGKENITIKKETKTSNVVIPKVQNKPRPVETKKEITQTKTPLTPVRASNKDDDEWESF